MKVSEAEREFASLVNKVHAEGITIDLERDNEVIARLTPAGLGPTLTVGEFAELLRRLPSLGEDADAFSRDVRAIPRGLPRGGRSMGLLIDTNVFISFEKRQHHVDFSSWEKSDRIYTSVVVASELLMGVHRADTRERRDRRSAFVEGILAAIRPLEFTLPVARVHAQIYADLVSKGQLIGAHDLMIAATARFHSLALLTDNVQEFSRVPGLRVIPFTP